MVRGIELAMDLARMPALAHRPAFLPIPADILNLMHIAAGNAPACEEAVAATGQPVDVVVQAARFYLQECLFKPEADCYRILGVQRGVERKTARDHMQWLLRWLHPDRNKEIESVYAERVLTAWREFSQQPSDVAAKDDKRTDRKGGRRRSRLVVPRVPWITREPQKRNRRFTVSSLVATVAAAAALVIAYYYFQIDLAAVAMNRP